MSIMTIKEMLKAQDKVMDIIKHCISLEEENASLRSEIVRMNNANRELRHILKSYEKDAKKAKENTNEDVSDKVVDHSNTHDTDS